MEFSDVSGAPSAFVGARLDLLLWEGDEGRGLFLCCHPDLIIARTKNSRPQLNPCQAWQEERGSPLCCREGVGRCFLLERLLLVCVCVALKGV